MGLTALLVAFGRLLSGLQSSKPGQEYYVRPGWGGGHARGVLVALVAIFAASGSLVQTGPERGPVFERLVASAPSASRHRAAGTCVAGERWGIRRDDLAFEVARVVNRFRVNHGLRPLRLEHGLMRSATWKAQHMARFFYFGHSDPAPPVSRGVPQRLAACGFSRSGSENIAYGFDTPREVVRAWLHSPGHRRNIVSSSWQYLGVGVALSRRGGIYWAQNFG